MYRQGMWRWGVLSILLVVAVMAGCAKKQTVRSEESTQPMKSAEAAKPATITPGNQAITETSPPGMSMNTPKSPAEGAGVQVTEELKSPFADIHFDFDKFLIKDGDKPDLRKIANYLKQHPQVKVRIEGNCDERGTSEYNLALGERRAESARKYLIGLGVPSNEVSTISFGKEKPLDPSHSEDAWAKNRRDHFDKM